MSLLLQHVCSCLACKCATTLCCLLSGRCPCTFTGQRASTLGRGRRRADSACGVPPYFVLSRVFFSESKRDLTTCSTCFPFPPWQVASQLLLRGCRNLCRRLLSWNGLDFEKLSARAPRR
ncbi:hypothetical protein MTO96_020195 [Rhipicephalus appendiculatus]